MKGCKFNWETEKARVHYEKGKSLSNKTTKEKKE